MLEDMHKTRSSSISPRAVERASFHAHHTVYVLIELAPSSP